MPGVSSAVESDTWLLPSVIWNPVVRKPEDGSRAGPAAGPMHLKPT